MTDDEVARNQVLAVTLGLIGPTRGGAAYSRALLGFLLWGRVRLHTPLKDYVIQESFEGPDFSRAAKSLNVSDSSA
jgi:hypothetical protein